MSGAALGYGAIAILLVVYVAWICLEMAGHAYRGLRLLLGVALGLLLSAGALAAGLLIGKRIGGGSRRRASS